MKIFISWSGERSKQVGLLLRSWLKCVLQASTPWMSDVDIDRGAAWFSEINKALEDCINGIICITKGNLNKPWLLFEAGALAKGLTSSRVYTFLVDISPNDVSDPLSQFNHTLPIEDGMLKLIKTLNSRMGDYALSAEILDRVFKTYWPQFDSEFRKIIENTTEDKLPVRKEQDVMGEILNTLRRLDRRMTSLETRDDYATIKNITRKELIRQNNCDVDQLYKILRDVSISNEDKFSLCQKIGLPNDEAKNLINSCKIQKAEFETA